jgi:hypothetical protein
MFVYRVGRLTPVGGRYLFPLAVLRLLGILWVCGGGPVLISGSAHLSPVFALNRFFSTSIFHLFVVADHWQYLACRDHHALREWDRAG